MNQNFEGTLMKRRLALTIVATLACTALVVPSAGATGTDVCSLLTKKEASKILRTAVVKAKNATNTVTGDQECVYTTRRYTSPFFKKQHAPLTLEIIWGALTPEVRAKIDADRANLQPIADLGDEAYFDHADVVVIRGQDTLGAQVSYWSGNGKAIAKYGAMAEAAARTALPRVPTG